MTPFERAQLAGIFLSQWVVTAEAITLNRFRERLERAYELADLVWARGTTGPLQATPDGVLGGDDAHWYRGEKRPAWSAVVLEGVTRGGECSACRKPQCKHWDLGKALA